MSDYVDKVDTSAGSTDSAPFSPSFFEPTTTALLDKIDWENPSYDDLANVDWAALHEEVMDVVIGEQAEEQLQPDRTDIDPNVRCLIAIVKEAKGSLAKTNSKITSSMAMMMIPF
ncbi:hypothetical protein ACEQ8H_000199 [Pleosporales sp. CAS-2024a]